MFTPCRDTAIAHSDPSACRVLMQSEADDPAPTDDDATLIRIPKKADVPDDDAADGDEEAAED